MKEEEEGVRCVKHLFLKFFGPLPLPWDRFTRKLLERGKNIQHSPPPLSNICPSLLHPPPPPPPPPPFLLPSPSPLPVHHVLQVRHLPPSRIGHCREVLE